MTAEAADRRVLGAIRFVDAVTGLRVLDRLRVGFPDGIRGTRNLQGLFVVTGAPGQHDATATIDAPEYDPDAAEPVEFDVADPAGRYLSRRHRIALPRDPRPANAAHADSLFLPVEVRLFPSPAARPAPGWAVVRGTVAGDAPGSTLPGALVRAVKAADGTLLSSGLADARGEALVAVPGIPVTTWATGGGAVVTSTMDVLLQVVWDPAAAGRLPDPDDLEARRADLAVRTTAVTLASGQVLVRTL